MPPSSSSKKPPHTTSLIQKIEGILQRIRDGGMVIMVDDKHRENEGDLVMAAENVTPEAINFMAKEARGLICLPMEDTMIDRLKLPMMSDHSKSEEQRKTAFTVSIEARQGVSTGISAQDRATTIKVAIEDQTGPHDLVVPGHVFPLKARPGGVLTRAGHTEGSVDLAKLAGKKGASVICEIMNNDGTMARATDLAAFSQRHNIPIISIEEIIHYRLLYDSLVHVRHRESIDSRFGTFDAQWFESEVDASWHVALIKGQPHSDAVCDVRVYRQHYLQDLFGAPTPPHTHRRIDYGLKMLSETENGVYLYLSTPIHSPHPSSPTSSASAMDPRLYGIGAQILRQLGVRKLILNTLTPRHLVALGGFGLEVVGVRVMTSDTPPPEQHPTSSTPSTTMDPKQHQDLQPEPAQNNSPHSLSPHNLLLQSEQSESTDSTDDHHHKRFMILSAKWHPHIVQALVQNAQNTLQDEGRIPPSHIQHWQVPGCYELISAAQHAAHLGTWDVLLCFGCIIKGKTHHHTSIMDSLNAGLLQIQLSTFVPIIHGVLMCDNIQHAKERSSGSINRGKEAAQAALDLMQAFTTWQTPS